MTTWQRLASLGIIGGIVAVGSTDAAARIWCTLKGQFQFGVNRICVYDCAGSDRYETIGGTKLRPLTVEQ